MNFNEFIAKWNGKGTSLFKMTRMGFVNALMFGSCDDNKIFYSYLRDNEDELVSAFGAPLDWFEANVASGFRIFNPVDDVFNEPRKTEYFEWLYDSILKFKKVLTPYVQEFKNSAASE